MIRKLTLIFLLLTPFAQAESLDSTALLQKAREESATTLQPLATPSKKKFSKNKENDPSAATAQAPSLILEMKDTYETPRVRSYDWQMELSYQSFHLQGLEPVSGLGRVPNISSAGSIPMLDLHFGFLKNIADRYKIGLRAFGGYGVKSYNVSTQTNASIGTQLNVINYGVGILGRANLWRALYGELAFDTGRMLFRQSSSSAAAATWSSDSNLEVGHLALGWSVDNVWDLGLGYQKVSLPGSPFALSDADWFLAAGVRW